MSDQEEQQKSSGGDSQTPEARQPERGGSRRGGGDRERGGRRRHPQNQPRRMEASLNMDELRDLVELIAEHGFTDFELEREGFRVRLRRDFAPQSPSTAQNVSATETSATPQTSDSQTPTTTASVTTRTTSQSAPPPTTSAPNIQQGEKTETVASDDEELHIIPSPIVGTFYRSPSPTSEPFVRLGSQVSQDTVVCIIEAMKLMNEIQAETSGEVAKIYVENGQPVEYGQPLFGIKK